MHMENIFYRRDRFARNPLFESDEAEEKPKKKMRPIPVSPQMETEEQGKQKAYEKLAKYFYRLGMAGNMPHMPIMKNDEVDIPDDWIDPKLKGKISGKIQDKEFRKNDVLWDADDEMEKLEKEVEMNVHGEDGSEDDEFDDFDYKDNHFGDDADTDDLDTSDMESSGGGGSASSSKQSEQERLKQAIDDAIDKLRGSKDSDKDGDNGGQDGQQGGQQGGGQDGGQDGQQGGGQDGGQDGQQGGGQDDGQDGSQSGSQFGGDNSSDDGYGMSSKEKSLRDLKKAIDSGDLDRAEKSFDDAKKMEGGDGELAGQTLVDVDDEDISNDMRKAGVSESDIKKMQDISNDNSNSGNDEEMRELAREVADGLEKKCQKKGGSALAKSVVRNALKSKIDNCEWRKLLEMFLKSKAINDGEMSKSKSGYKYGY